MPLLAAGLLLSSCGGGNVAGQLPKASSLAQPASAAKATVVIHWPSSAGARQAAARRARPEWVSPSAASLTVQVNGGTAQFLNAPTPMNGQTSSLIIDAPVGTDLFNFKAWDKPGGLGNLLGQAQVSQQIQANATNTVTAELEGVCTSISITPASNQPLLETSYQNGVTGPGSQGTPFFTFLGTTPETLMLTPLDADGNAIVGDPPVSGNGPNSGVPGITLSQAGTASGVQPVVAIANGSNQAVLKPIAEFARGVTGQLVAKSPNCATFGTVAFETSPAIYLTSALSSQILVSDWAGNTVALPLFPLAAPGGSGIAVDIATGNLFIPGSQTLSDSAGHPLTTLSQSYQAVDGTFVSLYTLSGATLRAIAVLDSTASLHYYTANLKAELVCGTDVQCPGIPDFILGKVDSISELRGVPGTILYGASNGVCYVQAPIMSAICVGKLTGANPPVLAVASANLTRNLPGPTSAVFVDQTGAHLTSFGYGAPDVALAGSQVTGASINADNYAGDIYFHSADGTLREYSGNGSLISVVTTSGCDSGCGERPFAVVGPGAGSPLSSLPSSLSFTARGQTQAVVLLDSVSTGGSSKAFSVAGCTSVVSVQSLGPDEFSVTAQGVGTCSLTFSDNNSPANSTQVAVTVTTTTVTGQSAARR